MSIAKIFGGTLALVAAVALGAFFMKWADTAPGNAVLTYGGQPLVTRPGTVPVPPRVDAPAPAAMQPAPAAPAAAVPQPAPQAAAPAAPAAPAPQAQAPAVPAAPAPQAPAAPAPAPQAAAPAVPAAPGYNPATAAVGSTLPKDMVPGTWYKTGGTHTVKKGEKFDTSPRDCVRNGTPGKCAWVKNP